MEFADLKNKSAGELNELLKEQEKKLYELRLSAFSRRLKQVHEINGVRRTIARIKSLLAAK